MREIKKNVTQFFVLMLLFSGSIFLWNCQDQNEDLEITKPTPQTKKYSIEKIYLDKLLNDHDLEQGLPLISKSRNTQRSQDDQNTELEVVNGLIINTTLAHKVIGTESTTWTFSVQKNVIETSDLENFLVKKRNGKFSYFLTSYKINPDDS